MKLEKITFLGAFPDGLLPIKGEAFEHMGRKFAVHKKRHPYSSWDKSYQVSDAETGFSVPESEHLNKQQAIKNAIDALDSRGAKAVAKAVKKSLAMRSKLPGAKP